MSFDLLTLRPRLMLSIAVGLAVAWLLSRTGTPWTSSLVGWCVGITFYMVVIVTDMTRASIEKVRDRASRLDDSALVILVIAMAATVASFGAIAALLYAPPSEGGSKTPDVVLAGITMVLSWMFTQVIFAVHYTHIFYGDVNGNERGGLQFAGDEEPDFWDFLYFTTSVGATAQTSDTMVTTRTMRRIVLSQSVYSFFFNTAVLALAINIAAGLAGH